MSTSSPLPVLSRPRHALPADGRYVAARRWTVGVLLVATTGLLAWVALLLAAGWVAVSAHHALTGRGPTEVDVSAVAVEALPGLLVGWCVGLAVLAVLARGQATGPRAAGLAAGATGVTAGWLLLSATGLL